MLQDIRPVHPVRVQESGNDYLFNLQNMAIKTYEFASGKIEVTDEKITFRSTIRDLTQFQSMERYNMGYVNSEQFSYLSIMPIQIALRSILFGVITAIIAVIANSEVFSAVGVVMIIFGFLLFNVDLWVDGLMGTKFGYRLCSYIFGSKFHKITIQNNSGGDHILFYVALDELDEAKKLETYKIKDRPAVQVKSSSIDDLEKISELYKKGILTEDEFTQKKKQLLNL